MSWWHVFIAFFIIFCIFTVFSMGVCIRSCVLSGVLDVVSVWMCSFIYFWSGLPKACQRFSLFPGKWKGFGSSSRLVCGLVPSDVWGMFWSIMISMALFMYGSFSCRKWKP